MKDLDDIANYLYNDKLVNNQIYSQWDKLGKVGCDRMMTIYIDGDF
jgi:hypothetical protein